MSSQDPAGVAIVGGGISGLAAAHRLTRLAADGAPIGRVVVFELEDHTGGRIESGDFAGVPGVDCGADAFLARVPDALDLAIEVGLGNDLVHPEPVGAAVWYDGLRDIPAGLVLGVPSDPVALARSGLLSMRGLLRAGIEPLLRRTSTASDSIGDYVRARFGDEVHERLVDALVGSIYATDTDRFSLAEIPQLTALTGDRSLLLAARRTAQRTAGTGSRQAAPIFAAPRSGMRGLITATAAALRTDGGVIECGRRPRLEVDGNGGWRVDDDAFGAVILATPAAATADLVAPDHEQLAQLLRRAETADVVMLTMHIAAGEFPDRLAGRSGYLVPKPVQRDVTAASFGSQKWGHWAPPDGGQIVRISIGRDGAPALQHSDDELVERALADVGRHLDVSWTPQATRINRWPGAFAQYRPHHRRWVDDVRCELPPGLHVAGSSFDGIGIPACIRSGKTIAERAAHELGALAS